MKKQKPTKCPKCDSTRLAEDVDMLVCLDCSYELGFVMRWELPND